MGNLTPTEKESSIHFDKGSDTAFVFTYERTWQSHFKRLGVKPTGKNGYGGYEYEIPKSWIRKPLPSRSRKKGAK